MANEDFLQEEEQEFRRFYKLSLWWVEHRALLKKIGYGVFIAVDAVLVLFVFWTFIDSFLISYNTEQQAVANIASIGQEQIHAYTQTHAAVPLEIDDTSVFSLGNGRYDFYTPLMNPNDEWYATVEYQFVWSGGETDVRTTFILPGGEKPLLALGVSAEQFPRSVDVEVANVDWHRVDRHLVGDYEEWKEDRLGFTFEDVAFTTDVQVDEQAIGRVTFTVDNNTAYSYFEPTFVILLMRGGNVVGVNRTTIQSLDAGEERTVRVNWFDTLPAVSQVEVVPDINIFDMDAYRALGAQ